MNLASFDPLTASDATKRQAQQQLAVAGYYKGEIDGDFWDESRAALHDYLVAHPAAPVAAAAPAPAAPPAIPGSLTTITLLIIACLKQYVGLVEKVSNAVWYDPNDRSPARAAVAAKFARALQDVGCEPGWAYCISAARAVWKEAYTRAGRLGEFLAIDRLMSVSVMGSYNALHAAGKTTTHPAVGAIVFLQHGQTVEGHAVVVTAVYPDHVVCIGANTSPAAGDVEHERNGDGVYAGKIYALDFTPRQSGLWLRGFLNPV